MKCPLCNNNDIYDGFITCSDCAFNYYITMVKDSETLELIGITFEGVQYTTEQFDRLLKLKAFL